MFIVGEGNVEQKKWKDTSIPRPSDMCLRTANQKGNNNGQPHQIWRSVPLCPHSLQHRSETDGYILARDVGTPPSVTYFFKSVYFDFSTQ